MLRNAGFNLIGRIPKLKRLDGAIDRLIELDIRPGVRLHGANKFKRCEICNRLAITAPDRIELVGESYDPKVPIQRILELPTYIVVSQPFKDAIERHQLTGSTFELVELR